MAQQSGTQREIVGVIGAGLMGRGITQVAAQAGFQVRLYDSKVGAAAEARHAIAAALAGLAAKGKIPAAEADVALARITLAEDVAELAGVSLAIEAIVERLDAKVALFRTMESALGRDCILATNTSSLSVTAIAAGCARPDRVAGLHFFSPVPRMKLVEVIDGLLTAPGVIERLVAFVKALGHTPVRAKDTPGFIVNHAGRGYGTEALRIAGEGIADFHAIDRILRKAAGFRMGPFELLDLTGLDVSHPVMESIYRQYYEEPRFRPSVLTAQRLAAGVLGRKSNRGFYDYASGQAEAMAAPSPPKLAEPLPRVWLDRGDGAMHDKVAPLAARLGASLDTGTKPDRASLCVVLPLGCDVTTCALDAGLDPRRTVGLDALLDPAEQRTLMTSPVTEPGYRDAAHALFGADGGAVEVIRDSPGFVTQRVLAHIVNIACDIAQQRIATPPDIDLAVQLGLGYPHGPLAWGDRLGPSRVLAILQEMARCYGDPRYRPSPWLSRRARLGVSLLTNDA